MEHSDRCLDTAAIARTSAIRAGNSHPRGQSPRGPRMRRCTFHGSPRLRGKGHSNRGDPHPDQRSYIGITHSEPRGGLGIVGVCDRHSREWRSRELTAVLRVSLAGCPVLTRTAGAGAVLVMQCEKSFKRNTTKVFSFRTYNVGSEIFLLPLKGIKSLFRNFFHCAAIKNGSAHLRHKRFVTGVFPCREYRFVGGDY